MFSLLAKPITRNNKKEPLVKTAETKQKIVTVNNVDSLKSLEGIWHGTVFQDSESKWTIKIITAELES